MTTPAVRFGYAVVVSFIACVSIAGASVGYANHVQKESERRAELVRIESDRRWCGLLGELDSAYNQPPPTTPTGRSVAAKIRELYTTPQPDGFGCVPG